MHEEVSKCAMKQDNSGGLINSFSGNKGKILVIKFKLAKKGLI